MKKIFCICAIALALLFLTACGNKAAGTKATPTATMGSAVGSNAPKSPSPGTVIVAESSNAVSDKEKQAVLDTLSKEIDDAFNAGKNLEDIDSSDLDTGNIE